MKALMAGLIAWGFVLAGCGGGSSSTSSAPSTTKTGTTTTTTTADYSSPADVIAALGAKGVQCTSPAPQTVGTAATYLQAATTCAIGGEKVVVATFSNAAQRARYEAIGLAGRGAYPYFVLGSTWAVATFTRVKANAIASAIGGKAY